MTSPLKRAGIIVGILLAALGVFFATSIVAPSASMAQEGKPHLMLTLEDGVVDIELRPDLAPKHVERVITLANQGFYDGIVFHRVIEGFMAQGGDPTGTGMGGSELPDVPAEFTTAEKFERAVVGAARSADPNSANSQFFIMFAPNPGLDGQYTIWGKVVAGMEFVDLIKRGDGPNGMVTSEPDKIISAKIEYRQ
jgi:peptidylprolyl isomerase